MHFYAWNDENTRFLFLRCHVTHQIKPLYLLITFLRFLPQKYEFGLDKQHWQVHWFATYRMLCAGYAKVYFFTSTLYFKNLLSQIVSKTEQSNFVGHKSINMIWQLSAPHSGCWDIDYQNLICEYHHNQSFTMNGLVFFRKEPGHWNSLFLVC